LEIATKRRETLVSELRRLEGKLEAAETALRTLEEECRSKGIDPGKIDEIIEQLRTKYKTLVEQVEQDVASADRALSPYLKETNG
jgi:predicted nuclease with TOPRIM domain